MEANDEKGWEYLKALPVNRRVRKKMMRSKAWVVNLHGGRKLKEDPIQSLNGQVNVDTNTEVIVVNAEILLDGGWCMRGPAYKALMWGAMTSRVKAVIGCPPTKNLWLQQTFEDRGGALRHLGTFPNGDVLCQQGDHLGSPAVPLVPRRPCVFQGEGRGVDDGEPRGYGRLSGSQRRGELVANSNVKGIYGCGAAAWGGGNNVGSTRTRRALDNKRHHCGEPQPEGSIGRKWSG